MSRHLRAAVLASLIALPAPASAQVVVVTVRSYDAIRADLDALNVREKLTDLLPGHGALLAKLGGDELKGVPRDKPFGLYALWPADPKNALSFDVPLVLFLPVAGEKEFLDRIDQPRGSLSKADDGLYRLKHSKAPELTLRFAHGYVYAADRPASLRAEPPPPPGADGADALPPPGALSLPPGLAATVGVSLRLDRVPKAAWDALAKTVSSGFSGLIEGAENELIRGGAGFAAAGMVEAVRGIREVRLSAGRDRKANRLGLELAVLPQAESVWLDLARYLDRSASRFVGVFAPDSLGLALHLPPFAGSESPNTWRPLAEGLRQAVGVRQWEHVSRVIQVLLPTLGRDGLDFGVAVSGHGTPAGDTVLVGLRVRDGRALGHLARDLYRDLPLGDRGGLTAQWNHARHGTARIHKFMFVGQSDEYYLAIGDEAVLFASGPEALPQVRKALDGLRDAPAAPTPFLRVNASSEWFRTAPPDAAWFAKHFPDEDPRKARLEVVVRGGDDLRLQIAVPVSVVRSALESTP